MMRIGLIAAWAAFGVAHAAPPPCPPGDTACLAKAVHAHPAKQALFWREALALPLAERIRVAPPGLVEFLAGAKKAGLAADPLGRTIAGRLIFELPDADFCIPLDELRAAHESFFPTLMGADAALA